MFNKNLSESLVNIEEMNMERCEEWITYLRYLIFRETDLELLETYNIYLGNFEDRMKELKSQRGF